MRFLRVLAILRNIITLNPSVVFTFFFTMFFLLLLFGFSFYFSIFLFVFCLLFVYVCAFCVAIAEFTATDNIVDCTRIFIIFFPMQDEIEIEG